MTNLSLVSAAPATQQGQRMQGGGKVNYSAVIGPSTAVNQIFQCPGFIVPPNCRVGLLTPGSNQGNCLASRVREKLLNGQGDIVPDITPIEYPVTNTAQIYVLLAQVGDTINLSVRENT